MDEFTNDEVLELDTFIRHQLSDMMHVHIAEMYINNDAILLSFHPVPVHLNKPFYFYKIYIWVKNNIYYIQYQKAYYEIEDFNDVFNVLDDIFDTLRPRDEY